MPTLLPLQQRLRRLLADLLHAVHASAPQPGQLQSLRFTVWYRSDWVLLLGLLLAQSCAAAVECRQFIHPLHAPVAQWIERPPPKGQVTGPIPVRGTTFSLLFPLTTQIV
jgi:hypothetical protein